MICLTALQHNKYLLSIDYVPNTRLGIGDATVNKTRHGSGILEAGRRERYYSNNFSNTVIVRKGVQVFCESLSWFLVGLPGGRDT